MKKGRLNTILLIGLSTVVFIVSLVSFMLLYQSAKDNLWNSRLESGNRRVREISGLLETQLQSGIPRKQIIVNLQKSIVNTDVGSEFICMYNTAGVELCHPNPALIGKKISLDNSRILKDEENSAFLEVLNSGKLSNGIRSFPEASNKSSEIVNVYPVKGTDWMVASHVKIPALEEQLTGLYLKFSIGFLLSTFIIIGCSVIFVRMIYSRYEERMNQEIDKLNQELSVLTRLNNQLRVFQTEDKVSLPVTGPDQEKSIPKKRIIAYHKDELVSIDTDTLAFVFLQNGITYISTFSEENYPVSDSLDELMKQLDNGDFYRANRQFIVSLKAIATIYIYGKNQLKLITTPKSPTEVIISKNKVASFKQWLDR
ncbi:LytTR family DNA-binding domain-containing protein [Pedobacter sp. B4-66]|uniref:LytTR family DNA-binding domain-containing protein n=1 Tax=Pedobacter sp. B4-66 TaxID=2817280 RepID=UPI001BDB0B9E|nr:LytTR family DNA-binding domain-containing protein [Pedobacter sp. B4-66]